MLSQVINSQSLAVWTFSRFHKLFTTCDTSMRAKYNQDLKCFSILFPVTWQNSPHLVKLRVASDVTFVEGLLGGD